MMVLALATLFLEPLPTQADNHISDTVHGHLGLWFRNRDSPNSRYTCTAGFGGIWPFSSFARAGIRPPRSGQSQGRNIPQVL